MCWLMLSVFFYFLMPPDDKGSDHSVLADSFLQKSLEHLVVSRLNERET